ncbi:MULTISPECIES: GAF domain-containing protein [unclassified Streptomyces]|uniref:GAF domain-containing protein n=1 Tax=unclassified Streptomyces TaxID=2593676 RepID=UPI0033FD25DD
MSYEPLRPAGRLLLTPEDKDAPARTERLRRLGLGERSEPALDAFADRLAAFTRAPYAMVNFLDERGQFFAGLHRPERDVLSVDTDTGTDAGGDGDGGRRELGRRLARDYGFCPHVVVRHKALVLEDVRDYPRFAGNAIVDEFGIRSYLGAPLIDSSQMVLGTVCVVDVEPRPWGREGLRTIKAAAAELAPRLERREPEGFLF